VPDLSEHPVDRLIRDLIDTRRQATMDEIEQIVDRIVSASFDTRLSAVVPVRDRGLFYQGQTLGPRAAALTYHLAKRIVGDREWAYGTTAQQYVTDLQTAVNSRDARLVLYRRRGGHLATSLATNRVPPSRLGPQAKPRLLVVFSADRGTIITGYQTSFEVPPNIPEGALWLK